MLICCSILLNWKELTVKFWVLIYSAILCGARRQGTCRMRLFFLICIFCIPHLQVCKRNFELVVYWNAHSLALHTHGKYFSWSEFKNYFSSIVIHKPLLWLSFPSKSFDYWKYLFSTKCNWLLPSNSFPFIPLPSLFDMQMREMSILHFLPSTHSVRLGSFTEYMQHWICCCFSENFVYI